MKLAATSGLAALLAAALLAAGPLGAQAPVKLPGTIGLPGGTGVFPATAESRTDAPGYTIYRPATMPRYRIPLVLWGNDRCTDNGLSASHFLREIASRGYFVIANGAAREEPPVQTRLPDGKERETTGPAGSAAPQTTVAQMRAAIDWAARADRESGGQFRGRIDVTRIAVMGHECGGQQALAIAGDPRVDIVAVFASGLPAAGGQAGKDALAQIRVPVLYVNGGAGDPSAVNAAEDVRRLTVPPVFAAGLGVGRNGTFALENGGEWALVATAWLDWRLGGDMRAGRMFVGYDCRLCSDPRWQVERKQFPTEP